MATPLTIVTERRSHARKTAERLELLELPPQAEWFIRSRNLRRKQVWHVRFTVTGHRPRIYGPFPSKRAGLLFLDAALGKLSDFWAELDDARDTYACADTFEKILGGPLIEHPLAIPRSKEGG